MDVHYYQFSICLKLFRNKKGGGGEPSDLQFWQGKNTTWNQSCGNYQEPNTISF